MVCVLRERGGGVYYYHVTKQCAIQHPVLVAVVVLFFFACIFDFLFFYFIHLFLIPGTYRIVYTCVCVRHTCARTGFAFPLGEGKPKPASYIWHDKINNGMISCMYLTRFCGMYCIPFCSL